LPRDKYSNILLNSIQPDLEKKLCVLLMIPFFRNSMPFTLLPFADALTFKKFSLGDYLIKRGDNIE